MPPLTMNRRIGIIGDYDPDFKAHVATNEALQHAADALGLRLTIDWLPTPKFDTTANLPLLESYDGLWASPGSPYQSMTGALQAIQFAREHDWPFFAT